VLSREPPKRSSNSPPGAGRQSVELVGEHLTTDVAALQKRARSLRLGIDTISATPNWNRQKLNMVDPALRRALLAEVESNLKIAQKMEVPLALLMSGNAISGKSFEDQFASLVEGAKRCGDLAAKYGVTLIVEPPLNTKVNHAGGLPCPNCVDGLLAPLLKAIDHDHVRLLFDLYHVAGRARRIRHPHRARLHALCEGFPTWPTTRAYNTN
jgi:sugar phosphate isomerase/epimerase